MKAGGDNTKQNIKSIDERIDAKYAPKFRSPSGQILGMPDIDGNQRNANSLPDMPSSKPSF
jgi:hypothetical protein